MDILKLLKAFKSKDPTRYQLTGVAVCGEYCYATDGHRAIRTPLPMEWRGGSDRVVDLENASIMDVKYPNMDQFFKNIPDESALSIELPSLIAKAGTGRKPYRVWVSLDGSAWSLTPIARYICIDARLLAPLADGDMWRWGSKDQLSPITLHRETEKITAVIMPMRG